MSGRFTVKPLAQRALVLAALLVTLAGCGLTTPPRSIAPHKEIEAIGVVASKKEADVGANTEYTYTFDDGRTYTLTYEGHVLVGGPSVGDLLIAGSKPRPWTLRAIPQDPPSWPVGCYKITENGEERDTTVDLDIGVTLQKAPNFDPSGRTRGQTRILGGAICLDRQGRVTRIY